VHRAPENDNPKEFKRAEIMADGTRTNQLPWFFLVVRSPSSCPKNDERVCVKVLFATLFCYALLDCFKNSTAKIQFFFSFWQNCYISNHFFILWVPRCLPAGTGPQPSAYHPREEGCPL
jgi:hypothetical protein